MLNLMVADHSLQFPRLSLVYRQPYLKHALQVADDSRLLRNAADQSVQSIRRIDVYRLAEKPTAPLPLTEEEFGARSVVGEGELLHWTSLVSPVP